MPKSPENGETRYIVNDELLRLYAYLDRADAEGLEHPTLTLAVRLQFEFSARMSEIRLLEWSWIDFENRRIVWPDSKTGDISKPMSEVAYELWSNAYRIDDSPYVCPAIFDSSIPLPENTYYNGWKRVLRRANVIHVGTHGIRHRAATDIANSGIPVKVGMARTAHKTVSMFMRACMPRMIRSARLLRRWPTCGGIRSTAVRRWCRLRRRRRIPATRMATRRSRTERTTVRIGTARKTAMPFRREASGT